MFVTTSARTRPSVLSSRSCRTSGPNARRSVPPPRRASPQAPPTVAAGRRTRREVTSAGADL
jgi:hypothetical protein